MDKKDLARHSYKQRATIQEDVLAIVVWMYVCVYTECSQLSTAVTKCLKVTT